MLSGSAFWRSGAIVTNPSSGEVLVDSGAIQVTRAAYYLVGVVGSATVEVVYDLQLRNAVNDATVQSQRRRFGATEANRNDDMILPSKIPVSQDQRLRCVVVTGIAGEVQLSLFWQEM